MGVMKRGLNMKKVCRIFIALAEGYALYKIPKSETIKGALQYEYSAEVSPGTIFKLSIESLAQVESKLTILAVSNTMIVVS